MTSPLYFCTYFDRNYLPQGLVLYESLRRVCRDSFVLWVLCFDRETHAALRRLQLPQVQLISEDEFEQNDTPLLKARSDRTRIEFYWTCTPSLLLYLFGRQQAIELLTYLDADLWFYSDPQCLFDEMGKHSILVTEHRYSEQCTSFAELYGRFNVSLLAFRRGEVAFSCLKWWRERCLESCRSQPTEGQFGDQKYLDDWPTLFPGVKVLDHKGAGLAPWNLARYRVVKRGKRLYVDEVPLIFYHFHGFRMLSRWMVRPMPEVSQIYAAVFPQQLMRSIYIPYARAVGRARQRLASLIELPFDQAEHEAKLRSTWERLKQQHLFIVRPAIWGGLIWSYGAYCRRIKHRRVQQRATAMNCVGSALAAYRRGDMTTTRAELFAAFRSCPSYLLSNRHFISILLESIVGSSFRRFWRRCVRILKRVQI
ncbi:MAG: hypothetical protein ACUVWX_04110 [Kiritimatiellia bacterium]